MTARPARLAVAGALAAGLLALAAGGDTFDFMPRGGRTLLADVAGGTPAQLAAVVSRRQTEDEWLKWVREAPAGRRLAEREQATLAAYLAVNMPAAGSATLPPDGRDLAWEQCQSCHSLFAGYLTQQGSATRWRNMFLAPFHRNIRMSPQEREEFARYSELNMPMKVEDVPAELRF